MIISEAKEQDFPAIFILIKNELGYTELNNTETINRLKYFSDSNDWITYIASDGDKGVTRGRDRKSVV